jgi:hypothetical protein
MGKGTALRALWASLTPFVWALHRMGACSLKWVHVCLGARRPDLFNPLWHHERFGDAIPALPDEVVLCGIGYRASASEGTVVFVCDWACSRITFERDHHDPHASLWYLTIAGRIPASHVDAAYRWVRAVFGGSFTVRGAA